MPAPDLEFRRIAIWVFSVMVIFPGFWISIWWVTHPLLDYFWIKLFVLAYFAPPAFLSMITGVADAHLTFWMPHPLTRVGLLLVFLFYWALSFFVAWVIFRIRTRRGLKEDAP